MKSAFSTLLRFAFTFYIFLKEHMLAIEYGVCKLPYPVAEYQEARFPRQSEVELYVAMTVNVVVNVFVRAHILFRVTHEVLLVFSHIGSFLSVRTFQPAFLCPVQT